MEIKFGLTYTHTCGDLLEQGASNVHTRGHDFFICTQSAGSIKISPHSRFSAPMRNVWCALYLRRAEPAEMNHPSAKSFCISLQ